jgi:predicted RNA-binding Zn-ribbon protein involved in translation (DUF1610 family)
MMEREAFVIMPFSPTASCDDWDEIYKHVFEKSFRELGWKCERAAVETGSLIKSIIGRLSTASVVLADLTDRNANVFYELGVRHSLSSRTIMVSQGTKHIPSDLMGYWHLTYGLNPGAVTKFKEELERILGTVEAKPDANDNPVREFLTETSRSLTDATNILNIKKLHALTTELSGNIHELKHARTTGSPDGTLIEIGCLSSFLETYYVDPGAETLALAYELRKLLRMFLSQRKPNTDVAGNALHLALSLSQRLETIREKLNRGSFAEPATPSLMSWSSSQPLVASTLECASCGAELEALAGDDRRVSCPSCGKRQSKSLSVRSFTKCQ